MDRKLLKSAISYALKTAYFAAILSLVVFVFWKSPIAFAISAAAFLCALIIEGLLFAFGFGLFTETKPVLVAVIVTFAFAGMFSVFLSNQSPLHFISSCSMLPAYSQGDAVLVLGGGIDAPIVKTNSPYDSSTDAEVHYRNETLVVQGSMYSYCSSHGSELCNRFIEAPLQFYEKKGEITFQYDSCQRSDGTYSPCVVSALIGDVVVSSRNGSVVVFPGEFAAAPVPRIAHRAMFGINDSLGNVYYFTKGDNNPEYDAQAYSGQSGSAVPAGNVSGKVVLKIPLLGALSKNYNQSVANNGCGSHYVN